MSSRYFWFSQHKTALMTVAKCLSVEVGELLPVLDIKIKQKRRTAMAMAVINRRKLSMTIDNSDSYIVSNDDWTGEGGSSHRFIHSPFQKRHLHLFK